MNYEQSNVFRVAVSVFKSERVQLVVLCLIVGCVFALALTQ